MNARIFSEAMGEVDAKYVEEAIHYHKKPGKHGRAKWAAIAACLCLLVIGGISLSYVFHAPEQPAVLQDPLAPQQPTAPKNPMPPSPEQSFVSISSLLTRDSGDSTEEELAEICAFVPIKQYKGIYVKTASADSAALSKSTGTAVSGTDAWYLVLGHTDMQYLIQNENQEYFLWKFKCFNSDSYPYRDVLELVYQIHSADEITEIQVTPATMDNTDSGRAIQAETGAHTVTDKTELESVYQILSSLTCYGQDRWDMIDNGAVDAAADREIASHNAVRFGRCMTLVTSYGNEIDGLKYTAVSDMFYEFSGISYHPLPADQADSLCEILRIEKAQIE